MKKHFLLSVLIALFSSVHAWSQPVDVETARQQAADFFFHVPSGNRHLTSFSGRMRLMHTQCQPADESPLLYVFTPEDGDGYAIISGETIDIPVLGYSDSAEWMSDSIPDGMQYWLDEYTRQLAFLRALPEGPSALARKVPAYQPEISPLIKSKWNQGTPYNNLCPVDQKTQARCVTGCVATAMAQMMYYHRWPQFGVGSHSYECQGQTLTAEFGKTAYQWDKMKNTYQGNDDVNNAVATLMFHCGVAVEMDYTSSESSAWVSASILQQYFNYASTARDVSHDALGDSLFEAALYAELKANRPVLFSGSRANYTGGHEFICDGYRNGYFHFNLGWGGYRDNYFRLGYILPASTSYNFSYNQYAICGIQKPGDFVFKDGIYYELFPDGTAICGGNVVAGDYTVPASVSVEGHDYVVISIAPYAFADSPTLTSVTIPSTITSVSDSAFYNCPALRKVVLEESDSPLSFGRDVFALEETECPAALEEVIMNRNIIDNAPFSNASKLQSVTLGNRVTELTYNCFWSCDHLQHLMLPTSCRTIKEGALAYCDQLTVEVAPGNPYLYTSEKVLFQKEGNILLFYPYQKKDKVYAVPEGVKEIAENAIFWVPITHLTLPSTMQKIGWAALWLFNLEEIICLASTPPSSPSYVFPDVEDMQQVPTLYVPRESMTAYQAIKPWNQFNIAEYVDVVGIEAIQTESSNAKKHHGYTPVQYYTLDGQLHGWPHRGTNIIRMSDGSTKKIFVR